MFLNASFCSDASRNHFNLAQKKYIHPKIEKKEKKRAKRSLEIFHGSPVGQQVGKTRIKSPRQINFNSPRGIKFNILCLRALSVVKLK